MDGPLCADVLGPRLGPALDASDVDGPQPCSLGVGAAVEDFPRRRVEFFFIGDDTDDEVGEPRANDGVQDIAGWCAGVDGVADGDVAAGCGLPVFCQKIVSLPHLPYHDSHDLRVSHGPCGADVDLLDVVVEVGSVFNVSAADKSPGGAAHGHVHIEEAVEGPVESCFGSLARSVAGDFFSGWRLAVQLAVNERLEAFVPWAGQSVELEGVLGQESGRALPLAVTGVELTVADHKMRFDLGDEVRLTHGDAPVVFEHAVLEILELLRNSMSRLSLGSKEAIASGALLSLRGGLVAAGFGGAAVDDILTIISEACAL